MLILFRIAPISRLKEISKITFILSLVVKKIASITPLQLQEQINEWSRKLVYGRKLKGLMNNIFKYAIRYGYISTNPVDSVTTLVKKESESSSDFYDKDELKAFMKLVDDTDDLRKKVMFRLFAFTGARKGEI